MLGEEIWNGSGQTTGTRILPGDDFRYIKMEVSIDGTGKALGADARNVGTFTAFERVPGQMYAEGQGIIMTADGESAIWNGHGVGRPTGDGMGMAIRYSVAYQASPTGKLAALNGVLGVGEFDSRADGSWSDKTCEWK